MVFLRLTVPVPPALFAGRLDYLAAPVTIGTRSAEREPALGGLHHAFAVARGTLGGLAARLGALALAPRADLLYGQVYPGLAAVNCGLEADVDAHKDVLAFLRLVAGGLFGLAEVEEILEQVAQSTAEVLGAEVSALGRTGPEAVVAGLLEAHPADARPPHFTKLVVLGAFGLVGEDFVGLGYLFELVFGGLVAFVAIRVILFRKTTIGLLDFVFGGGF